MLVVSGGSIVQQVMPQLSLSSMMQRTYILGTVWLPMSHACLGIVTNVFVKVYDLSQDIYCPCHNYMLMDGSFAGATFGRDSNAGTVVLFTLTTNGVLNSQELCDGDSDDGPMYLTNELKQEPLKANQMDGASIYYSNALQVRCCHPAVREYTIRAIVRPFALSGAMGFFSLCLYPRC